MSFALVRTSLAVTALAVSLAIPTSALAAGTVAPPGNSGVSQYLETVPGAGGGTSSRGGRGGDVDSSNDANDAPPEATRASLTRQGSDGRALLQVAAATAPAAARHGDASSSATSPASVSDRPSSLATVGDVLDVGTDSGGMGLLLPALLIGSACVAGALVLRRRHG